MAQKEHLLDAMTHGSNDDACRAVAILREHGWHQDHSTAYRNFSRANLKGADLSGFYLVDCIFNHANLSNAILREVNLEAADLEYADLSGADLREANLTLANLSNATLEGTNLQGSELSQVVWNTKTILPDGMYWTPATDLRHFTDATHPEFWKTRE